MKNSNSNSALVSVIVPVYNACATLPRCIESLAAQTYKNLDIVLVDDGSTDGSLDVCRKYASSDMRIRAVHKENGGPSAARNTGLEAANGEFVVFLDADDFLEEKSVSLLLSGMSETGADIAVGGFREIRGQTGEVILKAAFSENLLMQRKDIVRYSREYLRKPNRFILFSYVWGRMFRTEIIKKNVVRFDQSLSTFEDLCFNYDYLSHAGSVYFVNEVVYNYSFNESYDSATMRLSNNPKRMLGYQKALLAIARAIAGEAPEAEVSREVGHAYVSLSIIQLVRICGQLTPVNWRGIYGVVSGMISDGFLRCSLDSYSPSGADSRVIPKLIEFRLPIILIALAWYKAYRRYGLKGVKK